MLNAVHNQSLLIRWRKALAGQWLTVLLLLALLHSAGHIFVHLADVQSETSHNEMLAAPENVPASGTVNASGHACAGCESAHELRLAQPAPIAFVSAPQPRLSVAQTAAVPSIAFFAPAAGRAPPRA